MSRRIRARSSIVLALLMAPVLDGSPAAAAPDSGGDDASALATVTRIVSGARTACGLRAVDSPTVQIATRPVDFLETFPGTPLGAGRVDLRVTDVDGNPVETHWYIAPGTGKAQPLNPAAERLATGCRPHADEAPAAALDWHALPYLDMEGGAFSVNSSRAWSGSAAAPYFPDRGARALDDPRQVLWGATCSAGSQTVTLRRSVYLPGVPSQASIAMLPYTRLAGRESTVSRMAMSLNGRVIAATTRTLLSVNLPAATLARFHAGRNDLVVTLAKRRSGTCNRTAANALGVIFRLSGSYANDVTVTAPPSQTSSAGTLPTFTLTMTNRGPSTWIEPRLSFQLTTSGADPGAITMAELDGGTGQACAAPAGDAKRVICTLAPMAAGASTKATFTFGVSRPDNVPAPYVSRFTLSWRARGLNDPTNDPETDRPGSICFPTSKAPKCEGA